MEVNIFYRQLSYEEITQHEAYDLFALLCKYCNENEWNCESLNQSHNDVLQKKVESKLKRGWGGALVDSPNFHNVYLFERKMRKGGGLINSYVVRLRLFFILSETADTFIMPYC